jgi:O-antigen/teichoic acid export membrane protein
MASVFATLGLPGAFLHRAPETENEDRAAAVYLSMQVASTCVWLLIMLALILVFASGPSKTALLVITITTAMEQLTIVPSHVHIRRVATRRLALLGTINVIAVTVVTVIMAWQGYELWALLAGEFTTSLVLAAGLFVWRPIWRAWLLWDAQVARYYVRLGVPNMVAYLLENVLQRIDDIFVRYRLGVTEMGFYSRAYAFASYPRNILAAPISGVAVGALAEVAHDRLKLSKAFFRTNALLVRAGFLTSGWLILIAPEFVTILLGDKWMPMVPIFRLLSVYALLDPLRDVLGTLFVAVGQPRRLVLYRSIQLGVLLVGLATLGTQFGTVGVALAVDGMLVVGIVIMLWAARPWVDFSPLRLFFWPFVAIVLGFGAVLGVLALAEGSLTNPWISGAVKTAVWAGVFGGVLLIAERRELTEMWATVRQVMGRG